MNAAEFARKLGQGLYYIEFTKSDGSNRKMRATRMSAYVPQDKAPKTTQTMSEDQRTVPVFDTEILEWRSVTVANVSKMELI
jgi:hypothetical protein